jgi:phenylacetate-CoA ligase
MDTTWGDLQVAIAAAATAPRYAALAALLRSIDDPADLTRLPCSTKAEFRADFRAFLTGRPGVRLHATSGSTGAPAFVVYSAEEIESITLRAVETMRMAGVTGDDRVLNLFGYGTFIAGNLYDWGATRLGALVIPFGSASMTPPAFAAQAIRTMSPTVVNGVPSYLARFLGELRAAGHPGLDALRVVQCAGEVLTPALRDRLAAVVGPRVMVLDQYGMTEFGPLAAGCRAAAGNGMHLLEDGLHFEVLDDDGAPVVARDDAGAEGELVVTSLRNRAMALLRYRTGDRVRLLPGPCACGHAGPRIEVLRRADDLTKIRGCLCSKQEIVDAVRLVEGVSLFRVLLHRDPDGIDRVLVEVSPESMDQAAHLPARVRAQVKELVRIGVDRVEVVERLDVPRTVSGKPRVLVDARHLEGPGGESGEAAGEAPEAERRRAS